MPTTTTIKTAPPSPNQSIFHTVSDDKVGNNGAGEIKNFPNNQENQNTITNKENIDLSKLKPNVEILFTNEDHESCIAKIISRAGKTTVQ